MDKALPKKEIKSLTGIRGIAALYVMFYHWAYFFFEGEKSNSVVEYIKIFLSHGNWCVDLFFVLSGFLLSMTSFTSQEEKLTKYNYSKFMVKRFCRVYPIYFILTIVYFFLEKYFAKEHPSALDYFFNLTLFQAITNIKNIIPTAWSLSIEWVIYFFFPFIIIMTNELKGGVKIFVLYALAIVTIVIICNPFIDHNVTLRLKYNVSNFFDGYKSLLRGICSYLLGIAAYSTFSSRFFNKRITISILYIIFFAQIVCLFISNSYANVVFILLLPFTMLGLVKERSLLNNFFGSKFIHFLGETSFSLYLIHYVFVMSIAPRLGAILIKMNVVHYKYFTLFIILSAVILLSTILYYYIEKPLNKLLREKILNKNRNKLVTT